MKKANARLLRGKISNLELELYNIQNQLADLHKKLIAENVIGYDNPTLTEPQKKFLGWSK